MASNTKMTEDQTLVSRILEGDRGAFRLLIKQHERLVAHMISRLIDRAEDREELCQDVFLRVYEKIGEFGFQAKLSTWIATIAYRHGVNHLRKKKVTFQEIPDDQDYISHFISDDDPEETLEDKDMDQLVFRLIDQLPIQYRTVLTLFHVDGMNYSEIGSVTGMPEGTVKNYLFRARNLLKDSVKKYLGKEETT